MALYKFKKFLLETTDKAFDGTHEPGMAAPYPGIYRCEGCGHEIAIALGNKLPSQNHSQHTLTHGKIRWQLVVSHIAY